MKGSNIIKMEKASIRLSRKEDLQTVLCIYEYARKVMRENGNPTQWGNSYPDRRILEQDIKQRQSYVILGRDGKIHAVFMFFVGEEPTYQIIEHGSWKNNLSYGVIHRVASDGTMKSVVEKIILFCSQFCDNIRIDTHQDNKIMQHVLEKNGFVRCGIIYTRENSPRIAYQKCF